MSESNVIKKINKNTILVGIAAIAIIVTGILIYTNSNQSFALPNVFGVSDSQIGKSAVDYINNNQLSQTPATLVKVAEASGLVKVTIKIGTSQFDSYVTKDGKLLFPQAFDMSAKKTTAAAKTNTNSTTATTAVVKTANPSLEVFVVSSCPYGLQMQRAVADAVKNAPALAANIVIRYIGSISNGVISSMHGPEEAAENLRQICIRQEQPTKYYNYISCYMKKTVATAASGMPLGDSTSCQASTGIDTSKLSACVADPSRGLAYAQKDFDLGTKYNVSGSPTIILNGAQISESNYGGRSSDGVKSMVCAGFTTDPSYCSTKLDTTEAATSFNATYALASGAAASNNNCAPAAQ